jgi:hypothetical protein
MAIEPGDIEHRLSVTSGSAGDSTAQPTPSAALGKWCSTTRVAAGQAGNLFAGISAAAAAVGVTRYLCIFVVNTHPTLILREARAWFVSQRAGGADLAMGLDPAGVVAVDAGSAQAAQIATAAPAGVVFSTPTTEASGLVIGDIGPGECQAIWFRQRAAADPPAMVRDEGTYRVSGQTEA